MTTTQCCTKPSIVNLDTLTFQAVDGTTCHWTDDQYTVPVTVTNRVCAHCREHWYGIGNDITRYTRHEWDAYLIRGWAE